MSSFLGRDFIIVFNFMVPLCDEIMVKALKHIEKYFAKFSKNIEKLEWIGSQRLIKNVRISMVNLQRRN